MYAEEHKTDIEFFYEFFEVKAGEPKLKTSEIFDVLKANGYTSTVEQLSAKLNQEFRIQMAYKDAQKKKPDMQNSTFGRPPVKRVNCSGTLKWEGIARKGDEQIADQFGS